jgi:beta-glucosidase
MNRHYLDPVFLGRYPEELAGIFGAAWPQWSMDDFALIREPIDFIGVNYYTRSVTRCDDAAWPVRAAAVRQKQSTYTETGWEVYPQGLTDILTWVKDRYGNPRVYITENGAAFYDPPAVSGNELDDPLRVAYLREHLIAVRRAIDAGCDIKGYFVWSLLDNLEWSLGFSKRFGIIHVNFENQRRVVKRSARFYSQVIVTQGTYLHDAGETNAP